MPITQQLLIQFNRMIEQKLFENNSFVKASKDDKSSGATLGSNAEAGVPSKVSIPQEGANAEGGVSPENYPLPVQNAYDEVLEYEVQWHFTYPRRISRPEDMMTNYRSRELEVNNHAKVLERHFAITCLQAWLPTRLDKMVRTSGGNRAAATKKNPNATGTRKKLQFDNIMQIVSMFIEDDVDLQGAKALVSPVFLVDLFQDLKSSGAFTPYTTLETAMKMQYGVIGKLLDFDVMVRSSAGVYTNDSTPAPKNLRKFVSEPTDNQGILFWSPDFVRRFEPTVRFFEDNRSSTYQADLISSGGHGGAAKARKDEVGVYAIVQSHGA
jgi:hypothetical protein